jgi:hypothetical protein
MSAIKATWKDGQIVLDRPVSWPDGLRLLVEPDPSQAVVQGAAAGEGPMSPEEIAQTLAAMDRVQPFEMTDEELAAWQADRQARKEWEKTRFNAHADKFRGTWE